MNVLITFSGVGCMFLGYINIALAETATSTPESVFNWLAGIFSVIAGCICLAMIKHMNNEDKHLPKGVSGIELVSKSACKDVHVGTVEKIEETKAEFKTIRDDLLKKIDASNNLYLKELDYQKDLVCMLLKQNGIDTDDLEEKRH